MSDSKQSSSSRFISQRPQLHKEQFNKVVDRSIIQKRRDGQIGGVLDAGMRQQFDSVWENNNLSNGQIQHHRQSEKSAISTDHNYRFHEINKSLRQQHGQHQLSVDEFDRYLTIHGSADILRGDLSNLSANSNDDHMQQVWHSHQSSVTRQQEYSVDQQFSQVWSSAVDRAFDQLSLDATTTTILNQDQMDLTSQYLDQQIEQKAVMQDSDTLTSTSTVQAASQLRNTLSGIIENNDQVLHDHQLYPASARSPLINTSQGVSQGEVADQSILAHKLKSSQFSKFVGKLASEELRFESDKIIEQ
ncbi:hypothetical protein MP228_004079 [Amoeboaphelidium protococcarum]|nr:hypothetical protein MP228_004079 [Amoeboaphelidium protococcarum]